MASNSIPGRRLARRQRGLTLITWLLIIAIGVFLALIALKLIPIYLEHYSIQHALKTLPQQPFVGEQAPAEIRKTLINSLKINSVYDFDPKNIKITKGLRNYTVEVNYEVRKPVMGNVDVVVYFSDSVEIVPTSP
jgi:hypothetical protein